MSFSVWNSDRRDLRHSLVAPTAVRDFIAWSVAASTIRSRTMAAMVMAVVSQIYKL